MNSSYAKDAMVHASLLINNRKYFSSAKIDCVWRRPIELFKAYSVRDTDLASVGDTNFKNFNSILNLIE